MALVILEGPIDLLDVGKDDLGVEPARADHVVHVVAGDKVGDARQPPAGPQHTQGIKHRFGRFFIAKGFLADLDAKIFGGFLK